MMTFSVARAARRILLALCWFCLYGALDAQNAPQQLTFAGLRSTAMQGQINAVKVDAAGNLYLLLNQGDGVRLLKTDSAATSVLAQAQLGATGDIGLALAMDASGDLYVTGTTTSNVLSATAGAAIATRTDASTQSFVAKFDASLNTLFVTFTGGSKIAASAIAATADAVFVTGVTYASNLPVTSTAILQTPAPGSSGNGFVERFSSNGSALTYAAYLTGAGGDTNPAAIAADSSDNAYVAGSTSASGFPTIAAVVPSMLSNPSGFLTKLTPAGDNLTFSTFVPGSGLTSIALDATGTNLLLSGSLALGQFPVDTVQSPIAASLAYQTLVRMPVDGSAVLSSTLLVPGSQSFLTPDAGGGAWIGGTLTTPLFPIAPLAEAGTLFAAHLTSANSSAPNQLDQTARLGGLPNGNPTFASLPAIPTSIAVDASGQPLIGGAVEPTASSSLLATETYDLPLRAAPDPAFPSSLANAEQTAATCNGSLCSGSAAYLARLSTAVSGPALAFSTGDAPFLVLRNLGSAAAGGLQLTASSGALTTNCPTTFLPGAVCNILLTGGGPGTITAASAGDTQTAAFAAYKVPASTIAFFPKELDFGIATATSAQVQRTITITNLGTTNQTFTSAIDSTAKTASAFTEVSSDCTPAGSLTTKLLAPGATCHITLGFSPSNQPTSDGPASGQWSIGGRDVALTAFSQAKALSVSATEVDFGTQFAGGLRLPRFLYVSNASSNAAAHAPLALPPGSPFSLTDGCPSTLVAGSVCRIRIDYLSTMVPSSDATTLVLDDGLSTLITGRTLPPPGVAGTVANPNLSVSATSVTFANPVPVTSTGSEVQTVTIGNSGATAFALTLALSGNFLSNTSCTAMLAAHSTCAVALTFAPAQPGTGTGILAITAGAGTSPAYVTLSGTGAAILPTNNGTLALGSTPIGQPTVQFYKVLVPFNPLTATATGPYSVAFVQDNGFAPAVPPISAFAASVTGPCPSCYLAVQFLPAATGFQAGTLTLSSAAAGNPYTLALSGSGTAFAGLLLTPAAQDFGSVPLHSSSGGVLFTLTNNDPDGNPVTLSGPAIAGDYTLVQGSTGAQACSGSLAFGASCEFAVAAAPTATGTRAGSITLASASATLTTTAVPDPGLAINPLALSFANVPGAAATNQSVILNNTGSAPLGISNLTTASPFTASTGCATLAPSASCTISVTYSPGGALTTGSLSFTAGGQSYMVSLAGSYTASSASLQLVPAVANYGLTAVGAQSSPRVFTLNNLSAATQAVSVVIPRQFVLVGAPCTSLPPNGSCSFTLAFLPLDNGSVSGSVTAQTSTGSTIAYAEGYGTGSATLVLTGGLIANNSFSFGEVTSGQSASQTFTLSNPSTSSSLTVRRITSPPPFLASTTCGSTLPAAAKCTVTVTYTPTNQVASGTSSPPAIADSGALTIESDAVSSPYVLNFTGQAGPLAVSAPAAPTIVATYTLSQGSLVFPATTVGNISPAQTITLTNTGTVALSLLALENTADYTASSTCSSILAGGTCTITVQSTPQTPGTHIASLELLTNASTALEFVSLLSEGAANPLTIQPGSLTFGTTVVGTSSTLPVQVTNTGASPITFFSITGSGDYAPAGSCPSAGNALPAGQSCIVQVSFTPTAVGTRVGVLSIATSAATDPLTLALTGTGVQSRLVAAPSSLAFGSLVLGATANLSVTLTNAGTAPVSSLVLTPTGDYSVSLPCPATLPAGASCTAQVSFTPAALGARPGSLTITSSDPSSPITLPLTGTAIASGSFLFTVNGGNAATVSVKSGGPATYTLAVTPTGGFAGAVTLTCAAIQAAQFASCSIAPAAITLNGAAQTSLATINTITSADGSTAFVQPRRPTTSRAEKLVCLLLPGMWFLLRRRRTLRGRLPILLALLFVAATVAVSGCGSQGGDFNTRYTPPGSYAYQVTATSTSGIQITQTVTLNVNVTPR